MDTCNTASQGPEQTTLDTFFVPASEIGNTDKTLLKAQLDQVTEDYDSEFRNFPRGKTLTKHIFDTIRKHQGITTKKLIQILDLPKTTVYDHVKYLIEEERSVRKIKGQLHVIGSPPKVVLGWCYHNITVLFLVQHQVGVLNELCRYLNETPLFKDRNRKAMVWPPQRNWRPIEKSRSIKIACTNDPLTYKEMKELRSLIWTFFGQKKRLRFNLERNIDIEDSNPRKKYVRSTTISEQGRFIRQYLKKIDNKIVIRTEVSAEGGFDDVTLQLEEELEKEELWCKMRSLQKVVKELEKKNYRYLLDKEYLQKEIQQLKEELQNLKNN